MVMDHASRILAALPARAVVDGSIRPMTESERQAFAYLCASTYVLGSLGADVSSVVTWTWVADSDSDHG